MEAFSVFSVYYSLVVPLFLLLLLSLSCLFMSVLRSLVADLYLLVGTHSLFNSSFPFRPTKERIRPGRRSGLQEEINIKLYRRRRERTAAAGEEEEEEEEEEEKEEENCGVCFSKMKWGGGVSSTTTELRCGHVFHTECLDRWRTAGGGTCPFCRRALQGSAEAEVEEEMITLVLPFSPCLTPTSSRVMIFGC